MRDDKTWINDILEVIQNIERCADQGHDKFTKSELI